ncbi:MAG TPA: metallophosphoesterase family protein [Vicinamibacterales bacterium]|nr:metallophosphoesterase family protein [Vicinamibacterales bacterium]
MLVGLIADTHGLLRPEVYEAFHGVDVILHAGDVGGRQILTELRAIAPVHAVYGNVDRPGESGLAGSIDLRLEGVNVHVSHGHELGSPTVARLLGAYSADVIVFGHTHKALIERTQGALVVNPGAAGPRRFDVMPSVALLTIDRGRAEVRIVRL